MDAPLLVHWSANPEVTFRIEGWTDGTDHGRVTLRVVDAADHPELEPENYCSAPLSELSFNDEKAPDLFEALALLRNFKQYALMKTRRPGGLTWGPDGKDPISDMFLDLDGMENARPAALGPKEMRIVQKLDRRVGVKSLAEVPEAERDSKTCAIWVERDIMQYEHVPERHQTDDAVKERYIVAKCKKRAAEKAEAAAEAKKAKRREADRARRARKKAETQAEPPKKKAKKVPTEATDDDHVGEEEAGPEAGEEASASANYLDSSDDDEAPDPDEEESQVVPPPKPKSKPKARSAVDEMLGDGTLKIRPLGFIGM